MPRGRKKAEQVEKVEKGLTVKQTKEAARNVIKELLKKDSAKFSASFVGFEFNEKGGFASIIFNIEVHADTEHGKLEMIRDMKFPISMSDIKVQ